MHPAVQLACVVSASALALPTGMKAHVEEAVIDAQEGDVVRLSRHQRARLDALIVIYEGTGQLRTGKGVCIRIAMITLRCG
jgi:hypothetical protein